MAIYGCPDLGIIGEILWKPQISLDLFYQNRGIYGKKSEFVWVEVPL
jgi:hypothetical protein